MKKEEITLEALALILPNSSEEIRLSFMDALSRSGTYICPTCDFGIWDETDKLLECARCGTVMEEQ